jgi:hypothetical protein
MTQTQLLLSLLRQTKDVLFFTRMNADHHPVLITAPLCHNPPNKLRTSVRQVFLFYARAHRGYNQYIAGGEIPERFPG